MTKASKAKRLLGCSAIVLMVLVLLVLGTVGVVRHLWHSEPGYWTANQAYTSGDRSALTDEADRAFNRVMSELSNDSGYRPQPGENDPGAYGVRTIRLSFDEANAWLATRLNDWLVNQHRELPAGVSEPMLTSDGDSLIAAFRYRNAGKQIDQVFSVWLDMKFLDDGRATLHIEGVRGGRMPLPTKMVLEKLPSATGAHAHRSDVIAVLLGQEAFDPVLPIDGSRQARIIGMSVDKDSVSLKLRAEAVE